MSRLRECEIHTVLRMSFRRLRHIDPWYAGARVRIVSNLAIGLPELVTRSLEEYEALALRLAMDPSELRAIRRKLELNRLSRPLFDTGRFRRHLEAAYTRMWELRRDPRGHCAPRGVCPTFGKANGQSLLRSLVR
jgi:Glycosyl transferase family 41